MKILYVEDNLPDTDLTRRRFAKAAPDFRLDCATTMNEALERLEHHEKYGYDLALIDLRLPDGDGIMVLKYIRENDLPVAVVLITGQGDEESAVAALKAGADDYVVKRDNYIDRLPVILKDAMSKFRNRTALRARPILVLYAEHSSSDADLTRRHLNRHAPHINLDVVHTARDVLEKLTHTDPKREYDVLLLDYNLPGMNGIELLKELRQTFTIATPVVLVTGTGIEQIAVQAIKLGADDYLVKNPGYLYRLPIMLENAFYRAELLREKTTLLLSEERFRKLSETVSAAIFILKDKHFRYVNSFAEELTGYVQEELLDMPFWEIAHPDFRALVKERGLVRQDGEPTPKRYEFKIVRKDGEERWIDYTAGLIEIDGGRAVIGTAYDITDRKLAEQTLLNATRRLDVLNRIANVFITKPDNQTYNDVMEIILEATQSQVGIFGYIDDAGNYVCPSISKEVWTKCQVTDKTTVFLETLWRNLWGMGDNYRQRKSSLSNEPFKVPEGHIPINRAIDVPIRKAGEVIGNIIVANKETDYTPQDRQLMESIIDRIAPVLHTRLQRDREEKNRRRIQERLRQSEEKYRELANALPQVVFEMDRNGKILFLNRNGYQVFGYDENDVSRGLNAIDQLVPDDRDRIRKNFRAILSGNLSHGEEFTVVRKDGTTFPSAIHSVPVVRNNKTIGLCGIIVDLTERKKAEDEMRRSHQRLVTILDGIEAGVNVIDMDSYQILFANRHMKEIYDSDLEGQTCWRVLTPGESRPCALCPIPKLLTADGQPKEAVISEEQNPVTGRWYRNFAQAIRWIDGRLVKLGVATDITETILAEEEKIKTEKKLRQAQKMEAIGTLAGGIAHDFNNIISAIIGYTELALMDAPQGSKQSENLGEVLTAGRRAGDLTHQILSFARQTEQVRKPLDVRPLVKESIKLLRATLPTTIEIRADYGNDIGLINADPTEVHQVLMNLCTNAGHAMREEGGVLDISLSTIDVRPADNPELKELGPGEHVVLTVSDTGHGMTPEVRERIFNPYYTTKELGEGTGMGLSVVHGIVKNYEGTITAYSEADKGSTFKVYFPVIMGMEIEDVEHKWLLPFGTEHVLFVDDEPSLAEMGKGMLERLGYKVTTRTNGIEALDLVRKDPGIFDLVITDITMPHMTGDRLAQSLMEIRADLPIILCTGFSTRLSAEQARDMGVDAFLMKPLSVQELANAVRKVLDKKRGGPASD